MVSQKLSHLSLRRQSLRADRHDFFGVRGFDGLDRVARVDRTLECVGVNHCGHFGNDHHVQTVPPRGAGCFWMLLSMVPRCGNNRQPRTRSGRPQVRPRSLPYGRHRRAKHFGHASQFAQPLQPHHRNQRTRTRTVTSPRPWQPRSGLCRCVHVQFAAIATSAIRRTAIIQPPLL